MNKIKASVLVVGASGRMGQALAKSLPEVSLEPRIGLTQSKQAVGYKDTIQKIDKKVLKNIDIIIDFSTPKSFLSVANLAAESGLPIVSGTTGLSNAEMKSIENLAKKTAILWAPNMSLGVAALRRALKQLAVLKDFDFQVEETHHKNKKDSPSGTAILIQKDLEKVLNRKLNPPISIRAGGIVGEHKVTAYSNEEVIELRHEALDRSVFAAGAAKAARWLLKKKPGLYSLDDMLEDKNKK